MLSHHPAKFVGHRHCGSGDIMFLVAEEENCRCYHIINSDPGHTHSKQQSSKYLKTTLSVLSKSTNEKENEKKKRKGNCKRFALYAKRNYQYQMLLSAWTSKVKTSKLAL